MQYRHKALFSTESSVTDREEFRSNEKRKQQQKKARKKKLDSMTPEEREAFAAERKDAKKKK